MSRVVIHLRSGHSLHLAPTSRQIADRQLAELENIRFRKAGPPLSFIKRATADLGWVSLHPDDIIALELEASDV